MNRIAGIVAAVVGLIVALLGAMKVVPGITGTGVGLILLGGLVIGLSFVSGPEQDETPRMSTGETLLNIFISPGETFRNFRRHPRWLAAVLITTIFSSIFTMLFMYRLTPERVVNYTLDKTLETSWVANNAEVKKGIEAGRPNAIAEAKNPVLQAGQVVNSFVKTTYLIAFLALIFFLFSLAMGGKMNYWQAFAVGAYSMFPVAVIKAVLGSLVLFLKDPTDIHPILGQSSLVQDSLAFLVNPAEHAVLYVLLASLSLLGFYWIFLNVTGLKNAGEKVSPTLAWTATLGIWFVGLLLGLLSAVMFSGFMS